MMKDMRFDIFEYLRLGKAKRKPVIIVEGPDDIGIYLNLAKSIQKKIQVIPVGLIKDVKASNCTWIINIISITDFQQEMKKLDNEKWLIGIVDGDGRDYKPQSEHINRNLVGIHKLELYSYESYFVSVQNLHHLLVFLTGMADEEIEEKTINYFYDKFKDVEDDLFLISLDCLRMTNDLNYKSPFSFAGTKWSDIINNPNSKKMLDPLRNDINSFIQSKNIDKKNDKKKIIYGKWLINCFYEVIRKELDEIKKLVKINENPLTVSCKITGVDNCKYCNVSIGNNSNLENDLRKNCLWKSVTKYNTGQLLEIIYQNTDNPEFDEIKNVINALGYP